MTDKNDIVPDESFTDWVDGLSANGGFVMSKDTDWNVSGINGIPENWEVQYR